MFRTRLFVLFNLVFPPCVGAAGVTLDSEPKQWSYAIGLQIGQSLVRQGVEIDLDAFSLAVRDAINGEKPRLTASDMQRILSQGEARINANYKERAQQNLKIGREFLRENKSADGVVTLSSGLQYKALRKGAGAQPQPHDAVVVHYTGTLVDGREFDSSKRRGEAVTLSLNKVIKAWQEAIPLMRVGAKWMIYAPAELGYGAKGAGSIIGPNEALIFEIELLDIAK